MMRRACASGVITSYSNLVGRGVSGTYSNRRLLIMQHSTLMKRVIVLKPTKHIQFLMPEVPWNIIFSVEFGNAPKSSKMMKTAREIIVRIFNDVNIFYSELK